MARVVYMRAMSRVHVMSRVVCMGIMRGMACVLCRLVHDHGMFNPVARVRILIVAC